MPFQKKKKVAFQSAQISLNLEAALIQEEKKINP